MINAIRIKNRKEHIVLLLTSVEPRDFGKILKNRFWAPFKELIKFSMLRE